MPISSSVCDPTHDTAPDAATYRNQLERLEVAVAAAARALERLLYAQSSCAHAVRDIDDARQLLELPEEALRDQRAVAGPAERLLLRRIAAHAGYRGKKHETMEYEAHDSGHVGVYHIFQGCRCAGVVRWADGEVSGRGAMNAGSLLVGASQILLDLLDLLAHVKRQPSSMA